MAVTIDGTNGITTPDVESSGPVSGTNFSYTGTLTGGTGVVNLGSGQVYKDAAGNVGIGVSPTYKLDVDGFARGAIIQKKGTYTAGNTTPSVSGITFLEINNTSSTTITNFTGGEEGQIIYLYFDDSNTTVNRSNCYLKDSTNFVSSSADTLVLLKRGSFWFEISRSNNG